MTRPLLLALLILAGCAGMPANIKPVGDFQADRYLGTWYEIARIDNRFENGLSRVTAQYSLREDGRIKVVNRGFDAQTGRWKESVGKARFAQTSDVGHLQVSFFGPFYGAYVVFELDDGYTHALVSGPDTSYFWLLSRQPQMAPALRDALIDKAVARGFRREDIILVEQGP